MNRFVQGLLAASSSFAFALSSAPALADGAGSAEADALFQLGRDAIQAKDYVTDSGAEVYNVMKEKGLDTLFVLGVHTNMCVLNRSFAIKQMVKWDVKTFLVRDLTDAMYNPKMKPMVSHDKGTQLIIEHIEAFWCPTVESTALTKK